MVYRFDPDVERRGRRRASAATTSSRSSACATRPSDIPAQARALYLRNWLRLIPDARYAPVPLVPARNPLDGRPLDLGGADAAQRLAGAPGVPRQHGRRRLDVGLAVDGDRLWGLIACHHYAGPHRPSPADRVAAEFLGRTASLLLQHQGRRRRRARASLEVAERSARLVEAARAHAPRGRRRAASTARRRRTCVPAGGAAVRLDGRLRLLGSTPPARARSRRCSTPCPTDDRPRPTPSSPSSRTATHLVPTASGVLAVPVPRRRRCLAWFRPETLREVRWGGDPHEPSSSSTTAFGPRLSPAPVLRRLDASRCGRRPRPGARTRSRPPSSWPATSPTSRRRRAEEESRLAATLQRTLLLEQLPQVPGRRAGRPLPAERRRRRRRRLVRPRPAAERPGRDRARRRRRPRARRRGGHRAAAARAARVPAVARPGPGAALGRLNDLAAAPAARGAGDRGRRRARPGHRAARRRQRRPPAGAAARRRTARRWSTSGRGPALGLLAGARVRRGRSCSWPATTGWCCSATGSSSSAAPTSTSASRSCSTSRPSAPRDAEAARRAARALRCLTRRRPSRRPDGRRRHACVRRSARTPAGAASAGPS